MKVGVAGSLNSSDALVTVQEHQGRVIDIDSIVANHFGEQIKRVITKTLDELKLSDVYVKCIDRGALDYTIQSRLTTAAERMKKHA